MNSYNFLLWTGKNYNQIINFIEDNLKKENNIIKNIPFEMNIDSNKNLKIIYFISEKDKREFIFEIGTYITIKTDTEGKISIFQTHHSDINFLN